MLDTDFSDDFCRFLQSSVPAVDAAELLIWLAAHPAQSVEDGKVRQAIGSPSNLSEPAAAGYLELFRSRGLVVAEGGRYRFAPATGLLEHVQTLTQAYRERPVTLIRVIYALRDTKIQTFAEAFRLRKRGKT